MRKGAYTLGILLFIAINFTPLSCTSFRVGESSLVLEKEEKANWIHSLNLVFNIFIEKYSNDIDLKFKLGLDDKDKYLLDFVYKKDYAVGVIFDIMVIEDKFTLVLENVNINAVDIPIRGNSLAWTEASVRYALQTQNFNQVEIDSFVAFVLKPVYQLFSRLIRELGKTVTLSDTERTIPNKNSIKDM